MDWKNLAFSRWPFRLLVALLMVLTLALNVAIPAEAQAAKNLWPTPSDDNAPRPGSYQPGLVAVKFRPNVNADSANPTYNYSELHPERFFSLEQFREFGLGAFQTDRVLPGLFYYKVSQQADMGALLKLLRADPRVQYAEPNYISEIKKTPSDYFYQKGRQYYVSKVNAEGAWDITTGSNVVVAVVDTGIRIDHPDIQGNIIRDRARTFVTNPVSGEFLETFAAGNSAAWDPDGHGTAVAGIIAAKTNNGAGIAGISWGALLLPVQVCSTDVVTVCNQIAIASGVTYAADNKARIINLSLGSFNRSEVLAEAIRYAENKGVIIVAAAGNETTGAPTYPAAYAGVIGVGATDANDQVTSFSNFGADVTVVAPGSKIWTTYCNFQPSFGLCSPPNQQQTILCDQFNSNPDDPDACFILGTEVYVYISGTSFAAPIVTGILALMVSVRPDLPADQAQSILQQTADRVPGMTASGRDPYYGFGRVNAARAVAQTLGDVYANNNTILQGIVQGANLPDVVMSLDLGDRGTSTIKSVDPNTGGYRFEHLGSATYYLRALIPKQNRSLGPVLINSTGASGEIINVNFDFFTGNVIAGPGAIAPGQGPGTQPAPVPTPPAGPPVPLAANSVYFQPLGPRPTTPDRYFFPETGHTLGGAFKSYWDRNGGLPIFGYPLSEEFQEVSATDGKTYTVQYFERNRFEYHSEFAGTNNEVLLGLLGSEMTRGRNFPQGQPLQNSGNARYFSETGHTLTDRFYNYWRNYGGLAIFGYPISEPFMEGGYLVQYFERNRFEYHPENAGTRYEVLLGLLGIDLARARNYMPPAPRPFLALP